MQAFRWSFFYPLLRVNITCLYKFRIKKERIKETKNQLTNQSNKQGMNETGTRAFRDLKYTGSCLQLVSRFCDYFKIFSEPILLRVRVSAFMGIFNFFGSTHFTRKRVYEIYHTITPTADHNAGEGTRRRRHHFFYICVWWAYSAYCVR